MGKKHNILILKASNYSKEAIKIYKDAGKVYLRKPNNKNNKITVLVTRIDQYIGKNFLSHYPKAKFIISPTTGINHIDSVYCEKMGIQIIYFDKPLEFLKKVTSTAELTLGLILALVRKLPQAHIDVVERRIWNRNRYEGRELSRMTLGIVGLGRLGGRLAAYSKPIFAKVMAFDPFKPPGHFRSLGVVKTPLRLLLKKSDIVSIHARQNKKETPVLGKNELSWLKKGAFLVNTARPQLIDENEIVKKLRNKKIAGIGMDGLLNEACMKKRWKSPLLRAAKKGYNVIITPHIGGVTNDAFRVTEIEMAKIATNILLSNKKY